MRNSFLGARTGALQVFFSASALITLGACGGGGEAVVSESPTPAMIRGTFVDSPVQGLGISYVLDGQRFVLFTDENGDFVVPEGAVLTFFLGDVVLGKAAAADLMTPVDLVDGAIDAGDLRVMRIARLLQSLDVDDDPANGIVLTIDGSADALGVLYDLEDRDVLTGAEHKVVEFDVFDSYFGVTDLGAELATPLSEKLLALHGKTTVVANSDAEEHLVSSLVSRFAGSYMAEVPMNQGSSFLLGLDLDGADTPDVAATLDFTVDRTGAISGLFVVDDRSAFGEPMTRFQLVGQVFENGTLSIEASGIFSLQGKIDGESVRMQLSYGGIYRMIVNGFEVDPGFGFSLKSLQQGFADVFGQRVVSGPLVVANELQLAELGEIEVPSIDGARPFVMTVAPDGHVVVDDDAPEDMGVSAALITRLDAERVDLVGHAYLESEEGGGFVSVAFVISIDEAGLSVQGSSAQDVVDLTLLYYALALD